MKKNTNKRGGLIHVKLEYDELIQAKKDFLSLQRDLLRLVKFIKRHHGFRMEELDRKIVLGKKLKELDSNINALHKSLPVLKVPSILKKDLGEEHEEVEVQDFSRHQSDNSIERELQQIQGKLDSF